MTRGRVDVMLRWATVILALAGVAVAGYLTWVHYFGLELVCLGGGGGCETVQASQYASLLGVPVAVIGLGGYLAILASICVPLANSDRGRMLTLVLTAVGFAFSAYLTYLELDVIHAICWWCVSSAAIMAGLLAVSAARWLAAPADADRH